MDAMACLTLSVSVELEYWVRAEGCVCMLFVCVWECMRERRRETVCVRESESVRERERAGESAVVKWGQRERNPSRQLP